MLASDALQRIVATPTTTEIRGPGATAATFDNDGVVGDLLVFGNLLAQDIIGLIDNAIMSSGFSAGSPGEGSDVVGGLSVDVLTITEALAITALTLQDGTAAPVSQPGQAALRYLPGTDMIQYSKNGGPWTDLV